ncbi:transglycosylase SLT domain-containing protein [Actinomadura hibisca]|uniref:transglycosylase SLT domain-containing protein n=1 Tax=Actinomadura hibisca TaxID=68565 RepID=UPI0008367804|nr:transglycosylase SLT domain-containing protein [Actinomadura hibisca]
MTGIAEIASRVVQLQQMLAPAASTTASTGASTGFATALDDAVQGTGTTGGTSTTGTTGTTGTSTTGATSGQVTGRDVVADARRYLGVPYAWGGTNPKVGLDCSGLVQRVYADLGIKLPRVSQDQAHAGRSVPSLSQAQPGDLLTFGDPAHHIGIYVGDGKMLHAPHTGTVVKIVDLASYGTKPTAIRRVLSDQAAAGVSTADATGAAGAVSAQGLKGVPYADLFAQAGAKHGVSPALLAAVAKTESSFNPSARSSAGAVGLMQFMPGTARGLGIDPTNPAQAVDGAARLLKHNLKSLGSLPLAIAAYNAGEGAVQRYGGIPPYAETQAYVRKVQTAMKQYS